MDKSTILFRIPKTPFSVIGRTIRKLVLALSTSLTWLTFVERPRDVYSTACEIFTKTDHFSAP